MQAFIEEKSTPKKIIILIENVYNPMSMFEVSIAILKKYMLILLGKIQKMLQMLFLIMINVNYLLKNISKIMIFQKIKNLN